jgi:uncharacterized membrane protein
MRGRFTDERMEAIISAILRTGVIAATIFVLSGGIGVLLRSGGETPDFHVFKGEPAAYTSVPQIARRTLSRDWAAWIQFGLLVLIATPFVRVLFSILAFAAQGDRTYVAIATIVAGILLYSLFGAY